MLSRNSFGSRPRKVVRHVSTKTLAIAPRSASAAVRIVKLSAFADADYRRFVPGLSRLRPHCGPLQAFRVSPERTSGSTKLARGRAFVHGQVWSALRTSMGRHGSPEADIRVGSPSRKIADRVGRLRSRSPMILERISF